MPQGCGAGQGQVGTYASCMLPQLHPCEGGKQGWNTEHLAVPARAHQFWEPDLHHVAELYWQMFLNCSMDSP